MDTAKLFINGNSQAVRLPKNYRFNGDEVGIKRIGNITVLFPIDLVWETFMEGLNSFSDDFLADGREQQIDQERESL